MLMLTYWLL